MGSDPLSTIGSEWVKGSAGYTIQRRDGPTQCKRKSVQTFWGHSA